MKNSWHLRDTPLAPGAAEAETVPTRSGDISALASAHAPFVVFDDVRRHKVIEPLAPGKGSPITLSEFSSLLTVMQNKTESLSTRIGAASRLLPYCHKAIPEQTVVHYRSRAS